MKKILILFAHPAYSRSTINKALRKAVDELAGVTFHDLYSTYPDFHIDVEEEKRLCEQHDVIILQHPFYWYSTPAIVKEWFDLVLQHGWAYGSSGGALAGKIFFQAFSAGGDDSVYQKKGMNMFTIAELTSPIRATAHLCRLNWLPPFAVLGIHRGLPPERLNRHAEDYRRTIIALRDGTFDVDRARDLIYLNSALADCIREG